MSNRLAVLGFSRSATIAAWVCVLSFGCDANVPQPASPAERAPRRATRIPDPVEAAQEGQSANLLQEYAARDPIEHREAQDWILPFKSKRIAVALLIAAAKDRLEDLPIILAADATWGLPHTHRLGARPIFDGDDGERFLQAFRSAAQRFPMRAQFNTPPLTGGIQERVRTGAEPMWLEFINDNDLVLLRARVIGGRAWIDYVGFFERVPEGQIKVVGQGAPPPMAPPMRRPDGRPAFPPQQRDPGREQPGLPKPSG